LPQWTGSIRNSQGDATSRTCEAALRDGFGAIITTRPEQVAAINRAFAALGADADG